MRYFLENSDKSDCHVRQDAQCVLYSWNGNHGEVFGDKRHATKMGGCKLGDLMRMEVDYRNKTVCFYNYGPYTVAKCPDEEVEDDLNVEHKVDWNEFDIVSPKAVNKKTGEEIPAASLTMSTCEFMARNPNPLKVAQFSYVPEEAIPFCWFLGSGYKGSVTLFDSVLSFF
jgi:hypothetical protein